jgi:hypothetical protein
LAGGATVRAGAIEPTRGVRVYALARSWNALARACNRDGGAVVAPSRGITKEPSMSRFETLVLSLTALTAACIADDSSSNPPSCTGGKCDGASAERTLAFGVDRRPVDGALDVVSLEPDGEGGYDLVHEHAYLGRGSDQPVTEREVILEGAACEVSLVEVLCSQEDLHAAIVDTPFGYEATVFDHAGDRTLARGLRLWHARFVDGRHDDTRVELIVDGTGASSSFDAELRTTGDALGVEPATRALVERATCVIDTRTSALVCSRDDRPVDGALVTLEVAPTKDGYAATLETQYLQDEDYDVELVDPDLRLR